MNIRPAKLIWCFFALAAAIVLPFLTFADDGPARGWYQWGLNARHTGRVHFPAQSLNRILADVVYDPTVPQEQAATGGDLLVHYQVPLVDEDGSVFMEFKSGTLDPNTPIFGTLIWGETKFVWHNGHLTQIWSFQSDWRAPGSLYDFWEPVFHAVLTEEAVYVPGAYGSIIKLNKRTGAMMQRISPFGTDPNTYETGPITADVEGNLFYNVIQIVDGTYHGGGFYTNDATDSFLVKVTPRGVISKVSYKTLVPDAPTNCLGTFSYSELPWPPSPTAVPPSAPCGTVRVALNDAPAIGPDGTIYTVARTHSYWSWNGLIFVNVNGRYGWIVATNKNLTPKWHATLRERFNDGCGTATLPANGALDGCRTGANLGVDPATNGLGGGIILDDSSSTVTVAPDGVLYGAYTRYNYAQGHLMKFDFHGNFLIAFGFGWDSTPAIYTHDGTYSIVIKNNHYGNVGSYCNDGTICPPGRTANNPSSPEAYYVSQLNPHLALEWSFQNTNTLSCTRHPDNTVTCVSDHPNGFEWCVNAPVVDSKGVVYANSEDGNLYAIRQGGTLKQLIFQQLAIGAAYTPTSIGPDGKIYSQNAGHLFVVGH